MEEFLCKSCYEYKPADLYYYTKAKRTYRSGKCKDCLSEIDREKYYKEVEERGGGILVHKNPGQWADEEQKRQTYCFLEAMGWIKKPDNTWYKPGIREEDGTWSKINYSKLFRRNGSRKLNGVIRSKITKEQIPIFKRHGINELMEEYFIHNKKLCIIEKENEYGYNMGTIMYYVQQVYNKNYKNYKKYE
jgi:hypothetical protein